jgi:hypothetical protein
MYDVVITLSDSHGIEKKCNRIIDRRFSVLCHVYKMDNRRDEMAQLGDDLVNI